MLSPDAGYSRPNRGRLAAIEDRRGDYVISVKEAARILSISTRTVWRLIAAGKLAAVQISDRRKGILASEIAQRMTG